MIATSGLLVSLRLTHKHVLVVGGNKEALSRVNHALDANALVAVMSPRISAVSQLVSLANSNRIQLIDKDFDGVHDLYVASHGSTAHGLPEDALFDLVLVCANVPSDATEIAECCRLLRIPVNCADIPELCDFYFVAVLKEGAVQIGVSTNGAGPRLAARLRSHIQHSLPKSAASAVAKIAALRTRIKNTPTALVPPGSSPAALIKQRMSWMSRLCDSWTFEEMANISEDDVLRLLDAYERGEQEPPPALPFQKVIQASKNKSSFTPNALLSSMLPSSFVSTLNKNLHTWTDIQQSPFTRLFEWASTLVIFWWSLLTYPIRQSINLTQSIVIPNSILLWPHRESNSKTLVPLSISIPKTLQSPPTTPTITLIGMGPGDPTLLTLKAITAIHASQTLVLDSLHAEILLKYLGEIIPDFAKKRVIVLSRKVNGNSDNVQDDANQTCLDILREHPTRRVARLKSGDPFLYARGAEEFKFFKSHGVTVEIVAGVSSLGVLSAVGIPATLRGVGESLMVVSGRGEGGGWPREFDEGSGGTFVEGRTVVVFMGVGRCRGLVEKMIQQGYPKDIPAAAIARGTYTDGTEQIVFATLESLAERVENENIASPALLVVGRVVDALRN